MRSRKKFIESQGATCRNWTWSWSFINKKDKVIIFGAWLHHTKGSKSVILDEKWKYNWKRRKSAAYPQSLEHIRLIEERGYVLKTFTMEKMDGNHSGPAKIKNFIPELHTKTLKKIGSTWRAVALLKDSDVKLILNTQKKDKAIDLAQEYYEGEKYRKEINFQKRNRALIEAKKSNSDGNCEVCSFNYKDTYKGVTRIYLEAHHLTPIHKKNRSSKIKLEDISLVCSNCHRIIHTEDPCINLDRMRKQLK